MKLSGAITAVLLAASVNLALSREIPDDPPLVVGGEGATPGQFPYFVKGPGCGAVLIWPDIALTAAHCADVFLGVGVGIGGAIERGQPVPVRASQSGIFIDFYSISFFISC